MDAYHLGVRPKKATGICRWSLLPSRIHQQGDRAVPRGGHRCRRVLSLAHIETEIAPLADFGQQWPMIASSGITESTEQRSSSCLRSVEDGYER